MLAFIESHGTMILSIALTISEVLAFAFPNAGGILKAVSLLKGAGVKDVDGQ